MDMNEVNSSDKWLEFGRNLEQKTHNFTNPLLVQHKTHLQAKKHTQSPWQHAGKTHKWK